MPVDLAEEHIRFATRNASHGRALVGTMTRPHCRDAPLPGLLLLHEVGGVNPGLRATARSLARGGYAVATPDLYGGRRRIGNLARLITGAALRPLRNQTLSDLRLAFRAIAARTDVDAQRVGVIGYSMGAAYALQLACVESSLCVAAVFCGQLPRPLDALCHSCPIVASYAGRDLTCTGVAARLERVLSTCGVAHDVRIYAEVRAQFRSRAS